MKIRYNKNLFAALMAFSFLLLSCEKEDMVVDRVVSPVLVTIAGSAFTATEPVKITATIYELDKSDILNNAVGIDSIPVTNLAIMVKVNNATVAELTTNQAGKVELNKSWAELGLATPRASNTVNLEFAGTHKGQAFTKPTRVQVK